MASRNPNLESRNPKLRSWRSKFGSRRSNPTGFANPRRSGRLTLPFPTFSECTFAGVRSRGYIRRSEGRIAAATEIFRGKTAGGIAPLQGPGTFAPKPPGAKSRLNRPPAGPRDFWPKRVGPWFRPPAGPTDFWNKRVARNIAIYEGSEGRGAPDIVICDTLRASRLLGDLSAAPSRLLRDSSCRGVLR